MDDERTHPEQPVLIEPDADAVQMLSRARTRAPVGIAVATVVLIVVALVALLLLRGCNVGTLAGTEGENDDRGRHGHEPDQGMVSCGSSREPLRAPRFLVLPSRASPTPAAAASWSVSPLGLKQRVIARLKRREAVYDAGFVYGDPAPAR